FTSVGQGDGFFDWIHKITLFSCLLKIFAKIVKFSHPSALTSPFFALGKSITSFFCRFRLRAHGGMDFFAGRLDRQDMTATIRSSRGNCATTACVTPAAKRHNALHFIVRVIAAQHFYRTKLLNKGSKHWARGENREPHDAHDERDDKSTKKKQ
ncbi:MAG: hypothetical protein IJS19_00105, partial [Muribaculaceae bacterium]|nr:hypothetical protein [Muribaculaceae bacterium]